MAAIERKINESVFADKAKIQRLVAETSVRMKFVPNPTATIGKIRAMMLAENIRPEDNAFTTELMHMRYSVFCGIVAFGPNPS